MEKDLKKLEEKVEFMYDLMKIFCVIQLNEGMFKDWKEKKGIFKNKK